MGFSLTYLSKYVYYFIPLIFIVLGLTVSIVKLIHRRQPLYLLSSLGFFCFLGSSLLSLYFIELPLRLSHIGSPFSNLGHTIDSLASLQVTLSSTGFLLITLGLITVKSETKAIQDFPLEKSQRTIEYPPEKEEPKITPSNSNNDKLVAGLVHLTFFLNILGLLIAIIVYIMQPNRRSFVAGQAKQAAGYQVAIHALTFFFGLLITPSAMLGMFNSPTVLHITHYTVLSLGLLATIVSIIFMGFAVYAAIQAFQGRAYRYPILGNFINRL